MVRPPWGGIDDGSAGGCHLRLGYGWRLKYDAGPMRHTATIYPPQDELVEGSRLLAYLREREATLWRVWRSLRLWFGAEGGPEAPPHMHIAVPHAIPELAAEAGEVVYGEQGERLLWQDRSKGRLELEGTRPVMEGIASLPGRMDDMGHAVERALHEIPGIVASATTRAVVSALNGNGSPAALEPERELRPDTGEGYQ